MHPQIASHTLTAGVKGQTLPDCGQTWALHSADNHTGYVLSYRGISCSFLYYSELSCFNGIQMYKKETYISEISEVLTQVPCGRPQLMCKSQGILASIAAFI